MLLAALTLFLSFSLTLSCTYQKINVFGDSHALFSFGNLSNELTTTRSALVKRIQHFYKYNNKNIQKIYKTIPSNSTNYLYQYHNKEIRFIIHSFFGASMHKIGSDHNELFEFNNLKLSDSILIFNFGEVDCRYHIGKQVKEKKRDLAEILDRLISNYLNFIQKIAIKSNCLPVVLSIIPPTNMTFNPQAPYYGTIEERVIITESLNAKLELACITNNILFIDPYRYFKDQNGFLIEDLSDKIVHVDPNINYIVKDFVLDVLTTRQLI